ncbi:tyrosine--tRNA ligase [Candidatus Kaiserbacteria bacterium RIFCSPHIGHO2_02_FULL_49_11]|uniref:Tyrosine--tRNA ligase n=1 Tax=Candidatus Kaiserbacteria bacterium RIFCSPHIGHO2_02_FULL_49_11 TaxID=1798489 RepID=A0A1F6CZ94_9BACT|nr:MAG: tyrosine--tRNA ligase [Candidatus Kaiserbacteria bacterium RIFCSPHIGHO2_02_FULL_49_11]
MFWFSKPHTERPKTKLSDMLRERGYVYQHSSPLEEITDGPQRTLYLGIDPSADSLHVGNLVGLLVLRHFLEAGHKVILLTGGGTGMIGDPGGKSEERNLLDEATVARNSRAVSAQIRTVFGSSGFAEENNARWLSQLQLLDFLRDVGKHFTINSMIKKDTVKTRLDAESPMSFTEFSYSLLQGYDFLHLNEKYGCDVQVGGSDQWSNILSGVEFIRRKTDKKVYALTWPLLINKSTGKKFGKSEAGAMWLDSQKTLPFEFYQFWFNTTDTDVKEYLLKMTLLSIEEIDDLMKEQEVHPSARAAQKKLAYEVTALVHGYKEAVAARDFKSVPKVTAGTLRDVLKDLSTNELRRLVEQGGVTIGDKKATDINEEAHAGDIIRIGKSRFYRVE